MTDKSEPVGATPGDDISGLIALSLTTKAARDGAETESISRAYDKFIHRARRKSRRTGWLTEEFIRTVHGEMFGAIWEWAGKYRTVELNIGVKPHQIRDQIQALCHDFLCWDSSEMPLLEIAARLQQRLTWIHPFKNGNGRHARLISDIFFYARENSLPRWPQIQLLTQGDKIRNEYIAAVKKADEQEFSLLIKFIKSCIPL